MLKRLAPAILLLSLAACTTVDGQQRRGPYGGGDIGFSETRISSDRFRVSYRGRGDPNYAFDQALVRAAGLTLEGGGEWFVIEDRYTEAGPARSNGPFISLGGSSFSFGRRSGSSLGAGIGFNLGGSQPRSGTTLAVRSGRGARPEGAFDARDVLATVAPRLAPGPIQLTGR
jgi:hypothetical protein